MSIQGKNGTSRREVFSRELIVAFYFIFLVMTALCHKFGEVHIVHAFTRIVQIVYVPGIFFAVGYYIQIQREKYGDFKGCMLRHAAYSLGLYALLGISYEVFAKHVNPFTTIRNFITFIKVFEISAIFLSVSIVFLLCAYLWDYIEGWMEKPVLLLLICIIGFLPVFLPWHGCCMRLFLPVLSLSDTDLPSRSYTFCSVLRRSDIWSLPLSGLRRT